MPYMSWESGYDTGWNDCIDHLASTGRLVPSTGESEVRDVLKLEVGEIYVSRRGDIVKITDRKSYFMDDLGNRYFQCGSFLHDHGRDLIVKLKSQPTQPDETREALKKIYTIATTENSYNSEICRICEDAAHDAKGGV